MGEPEFRKIEHEQLVRIIGEAAEQQKPRIISLGGGTIAQPLNLALLRQAGAVLDLAAVPRRGIAAALAHIQDRPLFRDEASFRHLYEERLPSYEIADYHVQSDLEPLRVVEQILALGIFPKVNA